ncbi:uncharacterized protein KY384_009239 [Bacidia gigantensis]|uniref:uncharacterized protein n=1 Tax=Bacidia gigantensis TaxID=2732470 RepID=UPI001D048EF3|nr:uncharacterized protein KY384_009239 [Bacidia gigantensis]KAG8525595.1 hypothetical protein KY384_009239 [Bacidia gigantensis]
MAASSGNTYHDIHISGNARVLLGNTIDVPESALATRADFVGQYANSSLRPVSNYILRPELHRKIKEQLHDHSIDEEDTTRILVVWGLGGSGKSQLVLNYIDKYKQDYTGVFWVEAGSKETLERDYIQIYQLLYGRLTAADQGTVKVEDAVLGVKRWFQGRQGRWLLVLDSADTIDDSQDKEFIDLHYFLPEARSLHIIITSRSSTVKEITRLDAIYVAEMASSEAIELFQVSAKMLKANVSEVQEISKIVEELGYFALAITLAGSYVSVTPRLSSDIRDYLPEYRQRRKELLQRRPEQHIHRYGESVLGTWEVSFEAIQNRNPVATRLLSLLAFISFEDIQMSLFTISTGDFRDAASEVNDIGSVNVTWRSYLFGEKQQTVFELESAFEILRNYSLIQWRPDQGSYAMHKLVHAWGQDRLQVDRQRQVSDLGLALIADGSCQSNVDHSYKLRMVPHIMASFGTCSQLFEPLGENTKGVLAVLERLRLFLDTIGKWSEAYQIMAFHLKHVGTIFGKEHLKTLDSMQEMADLLMKESKHIEAEQMARTTLELRKKVSGEMHSDTLNCMLLLGIILNRRGKYLDTEHLYRHGLALSEAALGKEHICTLRYLRSLGEALSGQGKYTEAEDTFRRVLASSTCVSSGEHHLTKSGLAMVLRDQRNYTEVEDLARQVVASSEREFGKTHPNTLGYMNNLVVILTEQGRHLEAEKLIFQVLALTETVLGPEHDHTLICKRNLVRIYTDTGRGNEAEKLATSIVEASMRVLGDEHPSTLSSKADLSTIYEGQRRYREVDELRLNVMEASRKVLGEEHPETLTYVENVALTLMSQGSSEEAISLQRHCFELRLKVQGQEHFETKRSLERLQSWEKELELSGSQGHNPDLCRSK